MNEFLKGLWGRGRLLRDVLIQIIVNVLVPIFLWPVLFFFFPLILFVLNLMPNQAEIINNAQFYLIRYQVLILVISMICIAYIAVYRKLRTSYYKNEGAAMSDLRRDVRHARSSIKIIGHGCTSIFALFDDYQHALRSGVDISVLVMDPDNKSIMKKQTNLEDENLNSLIERLQRESGVRKNIAEWIRSTTRNYSKTRIAILLSLVGGWKDLIGWRKREYDESVTGRKRLGNLSIHLYANDDYMIKATIVDEKKCYFGTYYVPLPLGINNRLEVLRPGSGVKRTSDLLNKIIKERTTRKLHENDLDTWYAELHRFNVIKVKN